MPILFIGGIIILALGIILVSVLVKKYTPNKETFSLSEYYNITSEEQVATVLNRTNVDA